MADTSSTDSILKLMQLFTGKGSTTTQTSSGGTTTSGKVISQDTVNGMLKSALEGTDGLASVVNGQQTSGMYNSTTNEMLTNDLLSRLTTNIASASAPTVTTTTPSTVTSTTKSPSLGTGGTLALAGLSLGKSYIDPLVKKLTNGFTDTASIDGTGTSLEGGISTAQLDNFDGTPDTGLLTSFGAVDNSSAGEGVTAVTDAATASSDNFSDWFSGNYGNVADTTATATDATDTATDSGGGFFDTIKDWFS